MSSDSEQIYGRHGDRVAGGSIQCAELRVKAFQTQKVELCQTSQTYYPGDASLALHLGRVEKRREKKRKETDRKREQEEKDRRGWQVFPSTEKNKIPPVVQRDTNSMSYHTNIKNGGRKRTNGEKIGIE